MGTNLEMLNKRLSWMGGNQEERMVKGKWKTLQKTFLYSYQTALVRKVSEDIQHRALINPDKNKQDYDDKIISIDYNSNFMAGDVFEWVGTNTYWLVYLQELTEKAYFRSEIRRCKYQIKWVDNKEIKSTWAYIRGPIETRMEYSQKNGVSLDDPNWSLYIDVPKNEDTIKKFKRYDTFIFDDKTWRVQVVDGVSQVGILEITALEYFTNDVLDETEEGVSDAWKVVPVDEEGTPIENLVSDIIGDTFIKPLKEVSYTCGEADVANASWSIKEPNRPLTLTYEGNAAKIKWTATISGQFTLLYNVNGETVAEKIIVVESLF